MSKNKFQISQMNSSTVAEELKKNWTIIIPIGNLEPVGNLPLGAVTEVISQIANLVALKNKILVAPTLNYSYITPFKSFEGATGVRWNVFSTMISDLVRSSVGWGAKKIIFLDGGVTSAPHIHTGIKRYKQVLPDDFEYKIISWQNLPTVRKTVPTIFDDLKEVWRSDAAVSKIFSEIIGEDVHQIEESPLPQKEPFSRWKKMGMDPKKLRNLTSTPIFSNWSGVKNEIKLLPTVVDSVSLEIEKFMEIKK